jgi:hypothetical protein
MKQKSFRGVQKGKKSMAAIQQPKKPSSLPPRWWLGKMFSGFQLVFSYELLTWQLLSKCFGFSGPKSRA